MNLPFTPSGVPTNSRMQLDHDEKVKNRNKEALNSTIEEKVVEEAFDYLKTVSQILKDRFNL